MPGRQSNQSLVFADYSVKKGMIWSVAGSLYALLAQALFLAASARLLPPAAFGVFAAALLVVRLGSYLSQASVAQAIAREPSLTHNTLGVATTLGLTLGIASGCVVAAVARPASVLLHVPTAFWPMIALSGSLALNGISALPAAVLRRQGRFRALFWIEGSAYTVAYLGIGLSSMIAGAGVWSLIVAAIAQPAIIGLLAQIASGVRFRLAWDRLEARRLTGFSSSVTAIGLLEYASSSVDVAVVSRWLGPGVLGQYSRANSLTSILFTSLSSASSRVLGPLMASRSTDAAGSMVLLALRLTILPFSLIIGCAIALAEPAVQLVLGPDWPMTATVLPYLTAAASMYACTHYIAAALEAQGVLRPKLVIQLCCLGLAGSLTVAAATVTRSSTWIAAAFTLMEACRMLAYLRVGQTRLGMELRKLLPAALEGCLIAAVASCVGHLAFAFAESRAEGVAMAASAFAVSGAMTAYLCLCPRNPWMSLVRNLRRSRMTAAER